jgi:leucyl aminopeptidase
MDIAGLSPRRRTGRPVWLVRKGRTDDIPSGARAYAAAAGFDGTAGHLALLPAGDAVIGALYGMGEGQSALATGRLGHLLPAGDWRLKNVFCDRYLAALGWLLGAYRYSRYRKQPAARARLVIDARLDANRLLSQATSVCLARDWINTPANDFGPAALVGAMRKVAGEFGARVRAIVGEDLLKQRFPMVHAVGRAAAEAPRIAEFSWGRARHPRVTLVGKGVCFDSGGLNIKPGDSMALMKKDMGGAANVLALARMIMAARLPVRLRVIVAAVENAISAGAYRPGDILPSRKGLTVEIGNTDAEGRLILGDALAWADEDAPDILIDMATLTGAARTALGPELPALFSSDDALAQEILAAGARVEDPLWRLPLWPGYRAQLSSTVADLSHIGKGPMAGAITAALFLERFVEKAKSWVHVDLYAWSGNERPASPAGGEAQAIRAIFDALARRYPVAARLRVGGGHA